MGIYFWKFWVTPQQSYFWEMSKAIIVTKKFTFFPYEEVVSFIFLSLSTNSFTGCIHNLTYPVYEYLVIYSKENCN